MSKNNGTAWNTKYGIRRVRHEEATIEEAIAAAQGLSDDLDEQVEVASSLIGLPQEQVREALLNIAPARTRVTTPVTSIVTTTQRVVVVETKRPRRTALATQRNTVG